MQIKHSVIIITYNQEKLIARAIDSLLVQKEHIYEIIIADDCSIDNNWQIIKGYQQKYPELIKPYQNEKNLGIFGNIETTWDKATGNIIWNLSGDDAYCAGVFEKASELIIKNNFDPDNDFFTIYFDFKRVYPSGREKIQSNSLVLKHNPLSLKLRNLIYGRTTGVSKSVYDSYFPIKKGLGIRSDGLQDTQTQLLSQRSIYYPLVGSIYYTNIGIGSAVERTETLKSSLLCIPELIKMIPSISRSDFLWLKYLEKRYNYEIEPNFNNLIDLIASYWKSFDLKYGWKHSTKQVFTIIYLAYLMLRKHFLKSYSFFI